MVQCDVAVCARKEDLEWELSADSMMPSSSSMLLREPGTIRLRRGSERFE